MIYQCYFAPEQTERLFAEPLYAGFGLEPEVNPELLLGCPELRCLAHRTALAEYAAMLHLWRNPRDTDAWIGFTSYRQLDKFPTRFEDGDAQRILDLLEAHDILGWGFYRPFNATRDRPGSIAEISETCHPGITDLLRRLVHRNGDAIPPAYLTEPLGLFANYWIMSKASFDQFMRWSFPLVSWCLRHRLRDAFLVGHARSIGYAAERLFILWYLLRDKRLANVGVAQVLPFRDTGAKERIAS